MSRKPATDTFTRFTSTTPSFSSSQPPSFSSQQPESLTSSETAQQRVARLRAEHQRKRAGQFSASDRIIARGRTVADVLHRGTTYTLLGFSFVATVFAAYGLVSLVSHNRTQKRAWIEREMDRLEGARAAFLQGTADAEQLHLLEQERAGEEIKQKFDEEKRRKKEQSWLGQVKGIFTKGASTGSLGAEDATGESRTLQERAQDLRKSGFAEEEQRQRFRMGDAEIVLRPAAVSESNVPGVGLDEKGRPVPINKMDRVLVQPSATFSPTSDLPKPGQLDVLAENISASAQGTGKSWYSSIFGGSSRS